LRKVQARQRYSDARIRRERARHHTTTVPDDMTRPDEAQRTETSVTAFEGWELPGLGAGSIEYSEEDTRVAWVETKTGQRITAWQGSHSRNCRIAAPVANARTIFELYETIQSADYGILISADRRHLTVFTFEPMRYDIELQFQFEKPLAGLAAGASQEGNSRLILTDGGARFLGDVRPGVMTVTTTRATLLSALADPADMTFVNGLSEPILERLSPRGLD
jgi:hypothetical protein